MSNGKDPFEILADELTLIRRQIDHLQRTSLNKDEAQALNELVTIGVERMVQLGPEITKRIERQLQSATAQTRLHAVEAAQRAAQSAVEGLEERTMDAARSLSKAAGEARREAWRYFGGFWVWLGCVAAVAAFCGALVVFWLQGRADAKAFGQFPRIYCGSAGGQIVEQKDGSTLCAVWIEPPKSHSQK